MIINGRAQLLLFIVPKKIKPWAAARIKFTRIARIPVRKRPAIMVRVDNIFVKNEIQLRPVQTRKTMTETGILEFCFATALLVFLLDFTPLAMIILLLEDI